MPYDLSCPSCAAIVTSPFVRVGAVVICAKCGARYRIAEGHVKRRIGTPAAVGAPAQPAAEPALSDAGREDDEIRLADDGHVIGLSGLSEMMRQEPSSVPDAVASGPPALIPAAKPPPPRPPKPTGRRRSTWLLYTLVGGLVLAMGLIGGGLWYAVMSGGLQTSKTVPAEPGVHEPQATPRPVPVVVPENQDYESLPLIEAKPAPGPAWERINEPYKFTFRDGEAWLADEARVFTENAEEHFTASVISQTTDVVTLGEVNLVLVEPGIVPAGQAPQDRAIARTRLPVYLFGGGRRQRVRIPMPPGLSDQLLNVDTWVEIKERVPGAVYLSDATAAPIPGEPNTLLIHATNLSDKRVERLIFVLTALDDRTKLHKRFLAETMQRVESRGSVDLRIALPAEEVPSRVQTWQLEAAAAPAAVQPAEKTGD